MNQNLEEDINNKETNYMKTLKEYIWDINISTVLHEASLLDVEGTIKDGDNIVAEFDR